MLAVQSYPEAGGVAGGSLSDVRDHQSLLEVSPALEPEAPGAGLTSL